MIIYEIKIYQVKINSEINWAVAILANYLNRLVRQTLARTAAVPR